MSAAPFTKKMKQTDIRTSFMCSTKQAVMEQDCGAGEASQTADFVQVKKEVKEEPWKDQQQDVEEKTFTFQINDEPYSLDCDTSMTVLDALNTSDVFKQERDKTINKDKEVFIQRTKGQMPRAAVKTDFPCCLIDNDEIIDVCFMKFGEGVSTKQHKSECKLSLPCKSDTFVTFYVKKKGGDKVKCVLKSTVLRARADYVCVYAHKEDTLRKALRRDGRFTDDVFRKHCALRQFGTDKRREMSHSVIALNKKIYRVIVINNMKQPDSQEDQMTQLNTEPDVSSDADVADDAGNSQTPTNAEQETKHKKDTVDKSRRWPKPQIIPNSEEILGLLRDQFPGLLQQLKQREGLRDNTQVKKFFRAEYDKSSQSFSEVKKVRKLTNMFDSVCQIRKDGSAKGTGFLLFDRFILTNAHVIGKDNCGNPANFTAVFGYEDLDTETKRVQIKNLTSYFYGKDDKGNHLDYALLELNLVDSVGIAGYPELFSHYRCNTPDNRSQICIIGHPDGGVKKMDPCFVVGKERRQEAENKHVSENIQFYHVMSKQSVEEKWDFHKNQIALNSCFFHGSSGSPVFDADCKLIGVYTGGYVYMQENKTRSVIEYAYSLQPILDNIKAKAKIKGLTEVLSILEKAQESTAEQQNQPDVEMENVEGLSPE